jgi:hypothetical protein
MQANGCLRHDHVMKSPEPWRLQRQAIAEPIVALAAAGFAMGALRSRGHATSAAFAV